MRNILFIFFLVITTPLFAQLAPQKHSRVKVFLHETHISELAELGLEYDHGYLAKDKYWISDVSARELTLLEENNLPFEILIDDVQQWYVEQNEYPTPPIASPRNSNNCDAPNLAVQYTTPTNYTYGSMGGYHTYAELLTVLDDMKAKFPNLISERQAIGEHLTQEGRPIYWLKVGNNPNMDEDKPAILYNALHHAREPNSLAQMLFYIWYLLENYETDEEVKYLMDNMELYFIPCINPDGYIFNETSNPNGGGGWRKNRWVNADGNPVGVDLNRNYGFNWGIDNTGSSNDQFSDVYRGTAPFSEPETQAVRDFCVQHQFKIALNYHAFSNLLIIPWGFDNTLTPDDASYRALANKMTEQNNYVIGTGLETVGYLVNGDSDDWMYGEQTTKPKILSMTPEVGPGSFGFWPPASAIDGLNKDNLWQNISAAGLLKAYGNVTDLTPTRLENAEGTLNFKFQNIGLEAGTFTVNIQSTNEDFLVTSEPITITLDHLDTANFSIDYHIVNETSLFQKFDLEVVINNGAIERTSTITKEFFAVPFENFFLDNITDSSVVDWTTSNNWGLTDQTFFSANHSFTDSPNGNYPDNHFSFIQLNNLINLQDAAAAMVKFRGKWALETNYDYVQLFISTDQTNYTPLCGNYTVMNGSNEPAYNGLQNDWVSEEIDISDYIGQQVSFRFELKSDEFVNSDGFYFDDFTVDIIKKNTTTSIDESTPFLDNSMQITPNPFTEDLTVKFVLQEKVTNLKLRLLNTLGQEVAVQSLGNLSKGTHTLNWENIDLKNGFYFLQLQDKHHQSVSQKVLKLD